MCVCGEICIDGLRCDWANSWRVRVGLVLYYVKVVEGVGVDVEGGGVVKLVAVSNRGNENESPRYSFHFC